MNITLNLFFLFDTFFSLIILPVIHAVSVRIIQEVNILPLEVSHPLLILLFSHLSLSAR